MLTYIKVRLPNSFFIILFIACFMSSASISNTSLKKFFLYLYFFITLSSLSIAQNIENEIIFGKSLSTKNADTTPIILGFENRSDTNQTTEKDTKKNLDCIILKFKADSNSFNHIKSTLDNNTKITSKALIDSFSSSLDSNSSSVFFENPPKIKTISKLLSRINKNSRTAKKIEKSIVIKLEDPTTIEKALEYYNNLPQIESASINYVYQSLNTSSDPFFDLQWSMDITGIEQAWEITKGNSETIIAIIDTGVDYSHEDLVDSMLGDCSAGSCPDGTGYDFTDQSSSCSEGDCIGVDSNPSDDVGHGTHVAGIAAAANANSLGIAGVCPKCKIMPIRAGSINGFELDDLTNAIIYAVDNGANVINMSLGGHFNPDPSFLIAINYALDNNIPIIAAAGNNNNNIPVFPAGLDGVISVASTGPNNEKSVFSNYGASVDIAAPGGNDVIKNDQDFSKSIISTLPNTGVFSNELGYGYAQGTSMASPFVAGAVGLLLSHKPNLNLTQIKDILFRSVRNPGETSRYIGRGVIDLTTLLTNQTSSVELELNSPFANQYVDDSFLVKGVTNAERLEFYINQGLYPSNWDLVDSINLSVSDNFEKTLNISNIDNNSDFSLRVVAISGTDIQIEHVRMRHQSDIKSGWPRRVNHDAIIGLQAADLDLDGQQEIITVSKSTAWLSDAQIHILDSDGNTLPGWPRYIRAINNTGCIAIADIDGIPGDEVIVSAYNRNARAGEHLNEIQVFKKNGDRIDSPIFPDRTFSISSHCPSIVDLNVDGENEIAISSLFQLGSDDGSNPNTYYPSRLFIFKDDFAPFSGFPYSFGNHISNMVLGHTTNADIDGDGFPELITPSTLGGKVNIVDSLGRSKPQFPLDFNIPTSANSGAVIGDLDNDGTLEIVTLIGEQIYVLKADGSILPGWPRPIPVSDNVEQREVWTLERSYRILPGTGSVVPALADIDNDGKLDIIVGSAYMSDLAVFDHLGNTIFRTLPPVKEGFSGLTKLIVDNQTNVAPSPLVVDVDGDGELEILQAANHQTEIYAYNLDGSIVNAWPKQFTTVDYYGPQSSPIVSDLDNDGVKEIILGTSDGYIFVWKLKPSPLENSAPWPSHLGNSKNTGEYTPTNFCENSSIKTYPGLCGCNLLDEDPNCYDCAGTPLGEKKVDNCGVCGGDGSTCIQNGDNSGSCLDYDISNEKSQLVKRVKKINQSCVKLGKMLKRDCNLNRKKRKKIQKLINSCKANRALGENYIANIPHQYKTCDNSSCSTVTYNENLALFNNSLGKIFKAGKKLKKRILSCNFQTEQLNNVNKNTRKAKKLFKKSITISNSIAFASNIEGDC